MSDSLISVFSNISFFNNTSLEDGGAVFMYLARFEKFYDKKRVQVFGCNFTSNFVSTEDGGAYVVYLNIPIIIIFVEIYNSIFTNNVAAAGLGGAVYMFHVSTLNI